MKKFLTLTLICFAFGLTSCSKTEIEQQSIINESYGHLPNDQNLIQFYDKIDSLNSSFVATSNTRGFFGILGKQLADNAGRYGGQMVGRWLGAAVGTAVANPAVACIGYVAGQHIGGFIGYAAASALVEAMFYDAGYPSKGEGELKLVTDFTLLPSDYTGTSTLTRVENIDNRCDSIGYYHNNIMVKINQNISKYIVNGSVDINLLYDDIVLYAQEYGFYAEPLANEVLVKQAMKDFIKETAQISFANYSAGEGSDKLIENQCIYLKSKCELNDSEVSLYQNFSAKVAQKCSELTAEEIHVYAHELSKILDESSLNNETKFEISMTASTIINSSLCWQQ
jgi:hypothetical protein